MTTLEPPQFTGYAVLCNAGAWDSDRIDWESVGETIEEAIDHSKTWHEGEGVIVKVAATVEEVATMVECAEPEREEVEDGLLF